MKKHLRRRTVIAESSEEAQMAGLIIKMQQQLAFLEKKMDILISQTAQKPSENKQYQKPFQRFGEPQRRHSDDRQAGGFKERTLHKAVCADCGKECEVPFRPSGERPVYCKDCFGRRKGAGPFKPSAENRPREERPAFVPERKFERHPVGEGRKHFEKRKAVSKRRKKA